MKDKVAEERIKIILLDAFQHGRNTDIKFKNYYKEAKHLFLTEKTTKPKLTKAEMRSIRKVRSWSRLYKLWK